MSIRIVALLPMRHHSVRVPGKNYRSFAGNPLYHYVVKSLLACPAIDEIVIDTDSPLIMEDARRSFPNIRLIERPEYLKDEKIPMNEVLLHDTALVGADYYVQTHSTNPLLTTKSIAGAIDLFLSKIPENDSLFSVTEIRTRLWDKDCKAINHDPKILERTQDLPPVYEENSCLYIFSRSSLVADGRRIGENPLMFVIDRLESWDIDDELDFLIAEQLTQLPESKTR